MRAKHLKDFSEAQYHESLRQAHPGQRVRVAVSEQMLHKMETDPSTLKRRCARLLRLRMRYQRVRVSAYVVATYGAKISIGSVWFGGCLLIDSRPLIADQHLSMN